MTFRIYHKGFFFSVHRLSTKAEMYDKYDTCSPWKSQRDFEAAMLGTGNIARGKKSRKIGDVFFYGSPSVDTVIHEMVHCGLHYDRWIHGNEYAAYGSTGHEDEECIAETIAAFAEQYYLRGGDDS